MLQVRALLGERRNLFAQDARKRFFRPGLFHWDERPVYDFFRKILLTYGTSFGKMLTPGSIRKGNAAGNPKRTDKEDKQESMRSKLNRFIALLLCVLLTVGSVIPARASSLPEIGPGSVTTVAEEESTEENMTPAETSEENAQTEEPPVTEPEEQRGRCGHPYRSRYRSDHSRTP